MKRGRHPPRRTGCSRPSWQAMRPPYPSSLKLRRGRQAITEIPIRVIRAIRGSEISVQRSAFSVQRSAVSDLRPLSSVLIRVISPSCKLLRAGSRDRNGFGETAGLSNLMPPTRTSHARSSCYKYRLATNPAFKATAIKRQPNGSAAETSTCQTGLPGSTRGVGNQRASIGGVPLAPCQNRKT